MLIITGPNMGGKSTYMRQTALIVILAHIGCFVPARRAVLGPLDRIFTRIGASDDLAGGRSTFMLEMTETANILNNATDKSLVLMDEVGRGTSTFDGLSLAWACAAFIANKIRAFTLFATHYFELTSLAAEAPGVVNVHVEAVEHGETLVFLHSVKEGPANQSYGLQVAALAGIPKSVTAQARRYLTELERERDALRTRARRRPSWPSCSPPAPTAAPPESAALEALAGARPEFLEPARSAGSLVPAADAGSRRLNRPVLKKAAASCATALENSIPVWLTRRMTRSAAPSSCVSSTKMVPSLGARERAHQTSQAQSQIPGDDAQIPHAAPAALTGLQQLLADADPHDLPAERQARQILCRAAAAHRRPEQHDSPGRQLRVRGRILFEQLQDDQAAQAMPDQVQRYPR